MSKVELRSESLFPGQFLGFCVFSWRKSSAGLEFWRTCINRVRKWGIIKLWWGGRSWGLVLRGKLSILLLLCLSAVCGLAIYFHGKTVSYFLWPIWDTPPKPFQVYCASPSVSHQCGFQLFSPLYSVVL